MDGNKNPHRMLLFYQKGDDGVARMTRSRHLTSKTNCGANRSPWTHQRSRIHKLAKTPSGASQV